MLTQELRCLTQFRGGALEYDSALDQDQVAVADRDTAA